VTLFLVRVVKAYSNRSDVTSVRIRNLNGGKKFASLLGLFTVAEGSPLPI